MKFEETVQTLAYYNFPIFDAVLLSLVPSYHSNEPTIMSLTNHNVQYRTRNPRSTLSNNKTKKHISNKFGVCKNVILQNLISEHTPLASVLMWRWRHRVGGYALSILKTSVSRSKVGNEHVTLT